MIHRHIHALNTFNIVYIHIVYIYKREYPLDTPPHTPDIHLTSTWYRRPLGRLTPHPLNPSASKAALLNSQLGILP